MTAWAIIIVLAAGACLMWVTAYKIRHGSSCCGEREETNRKVLPGDRNPKHYPYRYLAQIEGMVCANCIRNVENAFHSVEGVYAKADLGSKSARVFAKNPVTRKDVVAILKGTSYTVIDFKEETAG